MQEKIVMALSYLTRATKEELYENMLERHTNVKMTTFLTEFYKLVKKGVIGRGDDGLYGLGVQTTQVLELFGTREPQYEQEIGENHVRS